VQNQAAFWQGNAKIMVPLEINGEQFGVVSLGPRKKGLEYTLQDREAFQKIVSIVSQAIDSAVNQDEVGHRRLL
jgi:hypothetical protein